MIRWPRPTTTGWTTRDLVTADGGTTIALSGNVILNQTQPIYRRLRFTAAAATNVVWENGTVNINQLWTVTGTTAGTEAALGHQEAVHFQGDFRNVYLDGLHLYGSHIAEGVMVWDTTAAVFTIQNTRIAIDRPLFPVSDRSDGVYHSDCFQSWGDIQLRMYNCTLITNYQGGMFGDPSMPSGRAWRSTILDRVNFRCSTHMPASSSTRPINFVQNDRLLGPVTFQGDTVYLDPGPRNFGNTNTGSFWQGTNTTDAFGRTRHQFSQTYPSLGINNG